MISFKPHFIVTLSETGKTIFFVIILGSNIFFFGMWLIKFYFIMRSMIRERYQKLYICLFMCCRKDRWLRENIRRAKEEKREGIISKIEEI